MIRAAAKNYGYVAVATDADDMAAILDEAKAHGGTTLALRKRLVGQGVRAHGARTMRRSRPGTPISSKTTRRPIARSAAS